MSNDPRRSDRRILRLLAWARWGALVVGILVSVILTEAPGLALAAAAPAGIYVLTLSGIPYPLLQRRFASEAVMLGAALLTLTAVTLTGAADSPYLLLSYLPSMEATVLGGLRLGLATAGLSAGLLVAVTLAQNPEGMLQAVGPALLYLVVAVTVAQIRRLLLDAEQRATSLEESSQVAQRRLSQLESAHDLLSRLSDIVSSENVSPISLGKAALESIIRDRPGTSGLAVIQGDRGPVVVARVGSESSHGQRSTIPLVVGEREVGTVVLFTPEPLSASERSDLETTLRPLALAFSNVLLLETIARAAIKEERTRLARELHDEIGPSLASLGLALDVALLENRGDADLTEHLARLRQNVGSLVDEVRATVSDLRTERRDTLTRLLAELERELPPPPELKVTLDERRPPRPSIADEISRILVEAVRNAHRHSRGTLVHVHGWVDYNRGRVVVEDDGVGFDPSGEYQGHFGLVGMQERSLRIGARLSINSSDTGTAVTLEWGEP